MKGHKSPRAGQVYNKQRENKVLGDSDSWSLEEFGDPNYYFNIIKMIQYELASKQDCHIRFDVQRTQFNSRYKIQSLGPTQVMIQAFSENKRDRRLHK